MSKYFCLYHLLHFFMNYALNMKVYCIPASQIASPCFPISSQRGRPYIDRPHKVPGALFSCQICRHHRLYSPGLTGLLAISRLTGGWHEAIFAKMSRYSSFCAFQPPFFPNQGDKTASFSATISFLHENSSCRPAMMLL